MYCNVEGVTRTIVSTVSNVGSINIVQVVYYNENKMDIDYKWNLFTVKRYIILFYVYKL